MIKYLIAFSLDECADVIFVEESVEEVVTPTEGASFDAINEDTESISIYGRWGNKVFELKNPEPDFVWFGRKDDGTMLAEGTYYFIIIQDDFTVTGITKGFITLLN